MPFLGTYQIRDLNFISSLHARVNRKNPTELNIKIHADVKKIWDKLKSHLNLADNLYAGYIKNDMKH